MRIAVVAPSGPPLQTRVDAGLQLIRAAGHDATVHGTIGGSGTISYLNDKDDARTEALLGALTSGVDVVWCARGGYGLHRLLTTLIPALPARPPIMMGFSDVTALFAIAAGRGLLDRCIHGPLLTTLADEPSDSQQRVWDALYGKQLASLPVWGEGSFTVEGPLFAANLTVLAALVGTPAMPSLAGHVLVLEEVGEAPYRLDRMMTQLWLSGSLDGVRGIVVGQLTKCDLASGTTALATLQERADAASIPLAWGLGVGHESPNAALPLGRRVRVSVAGGTGTLTWL
jgi:muramoyltetrapeptide carboxypeptidase